MAKILTLSSSITRPADTTPYASGDVLSAVTSNNHHTFSNVFKRPMCQGIISQAIITSSAYVATGPDLDLVLFTSDIAKVADNAAAAVTDTELAAIATVINFPTGSWQPVNATAGAGGNNLQIVANVDRFLSNPNREIGITGIVSTTTTATATAAAAHGLSVGDQVSVRGADTATAEYNGLKTVLTVPSTTSFTYTVDADVADTAVVGTVGFFSGTVLGRTNLYGQLILRNAYVPVASEIFTVTLVVEQF